MMQPDRLTIACLLAGSLSLKDVAHLQAPDFGDPRLRLLFAIVTSLLECGASPRTDRIVKVVGMCGLPLDGWEELVAALRAKGEEFAEEAHKTARGGW